MIRRVLCAVLLVVPSLAFAQQPTPDDGLRRCTDGGGFRNGITKDFKLESCRLIVEDGFTVESKGSCFSKSLPPGARPTNKPTPSNPEGGVTVIFTVDGCTLVFCEGLVIDFAGAACGADI